MAESLASIRAISTSLASRMSCCSLRRAACCSSLDLCASY